MGKLSGDELFNLVRRFTIIFSKSDEGCQLDKLEKGSDPPLSVAC